MATMKDALRAQLTAALRMRDDDAVRVLRTAIAAVENAEAVPLVHGERAGAIETSPALGASEAPRRELTTDEEVALVRAEIAERSRAAAQVAASHPDAAQRLRHEAEILTIALAHAGQ